MLTKKRLLGFVDQLREKDATRWTPQESYLLRYIIAFTNTRYFNSQLSDDDAVNYQDFPGFFQNRTGYSLSHALSLYYLEQNSLIRCFLEIWSCAISNDETFLLTPLFEVPAIHWLVIDGVAYDAQELALNKDQGHFYRHPQNNMPFSTEAVTIMSRYPVLSSYASKLSRYHQQQRPIPSVLLEAVYKLLQTYLSYAKQFQSRTVYFDDAALDQCLDADAAFEAEFTLMPVEIQDQFYNYLLHVDFDDGGRYVTTIRDVIYATPENYNGCIMVKQAYLWYLLVCHDPERIQFPREIASSFEASGMKLPDGATYRYYLDWPIPIRRLRSLNGLGLFGSRDGDADRAHADAGVGRQRERSPVRGEYDPRLLDWPVSTSGSDQSTPPTLNL